MDPTSPTGDSSEPPPEPSIAASARPNCHTTSDGALPGRVNCVDSRSPAPTIPLGSSSGARYVSLMLALASASSRPLASTGTVWPWATRPLSVSRTATPLTDSPVMSSDDDFSSAPPVAGSFVCADETIEAILRGPTAKPCAFDSTPPSSSWRTDVTADVSSALWSPPWPEVATPSEVVTVLVARRWNGPLPISSLGVPGFIDSA